MDEESNHPQHRAHHHRHFHSLPLLKFQRSSTESVPDIVDPGYTSLRDIIIKSPPCQGSSSAQATTLEGGSEGEQASANVISIRNQLVRRAASMYLQSAIVLVDYRDQSFHIRFWRRLKMRASTCLCWRVYVQNPLRTLLLRMYRFFTCMLRS